MSRPRKIPITVTQADIDNGKPTFARECPVALACRRALNHEVRIEDEVIKLTGDGEIDQPDSVLEFVERFDRHNEVKPFSFKLPLTAEQAAFLKL